MSMTRWPVDAVPSSSRWIGGGAEAAAERAAESIFTLSAFASAAEASGCMASDDGNGMTFGRVFRRARCVEDAKTVRHIQKIIYGHRCIHRDHTHYYTTTHRDGVRHDIEEETEPETKGECE